MIFFRNRAMSGVLILFWVSVLLTLCSCTSLTKPSPKKASISFMQIYNAEYADYMARTGYVMIDDRWQQTITVYLSDTEKAFLIKKKALLTKVWPMLKTYNAFLLLGETPPADLVSDITGIFANIENLLLN